MLPYAIIVEDKRGGQYAYLTPPGVAYAISNNLSFAPKDTRLMPLDKIDSIDIYPTIDAQIDREHAVFRVEGKKDKGYDITLN